MGILQLEINEIFTAKNVIIYFLIINIISFLAMWIDKEKAKKGSWRIKESTLFFLVFFGGGIGGIAGMYLFRHKTKKLYFTLGFPIILITEIVCLLVFTVQYYLIKY